MEADKCPRCGRERTGDEPEGLCPRCLMQSAAEVSPTRAAFEAPTVEALAGHFPDYDIESLLGRGGMGAVYRARDRKLDRPVAIKVLPPEVGADPEFAERFLREARVLGRLNHVNIVQVHDFGESNGLLYIVMAHVDGGNLRDAMRKGRMDADEATLILREVADALAYAHSEGVVHRDIKPENVLLGKDGHVRLADFGLVRLVDPDGLSATRQSIGTPYYMAPEQVTRPASVDSRADIYSFGVLAYEILTGELPVGQFPAASATPGVPAYLGDLLARCLQRDPESRWEEMAGVRDALVDRMPAPVAGKPASSPVPRSQDGLRRNTLNRLAVLGLLGFLFCFSPWYSVRTSFTKRGEWGNLVVTTAWDSGVGVSALDTRFDLGLFNFPGWIYPIVAAVLVALALIQRGGSSAFLPRVYMIIAGFFLIAVCITGYKTMRIERAGISMAPGFGLFAELFVWAAVFVVLHLDREAPKQRPAGPGKGQRRIEGRRSRMLRRATGSRDAASHNDQSTDRQRNSGSDEPTPS